VAELYIDPDAVAAAGTRVGAAGSGSATPLAGPISPPAADPVSAAIAQTLAARMAAIGAHSSAAMAITGIRAGMLNTSAATYTCREDSNRASLALGAAPEAAEIPSVPTISAPMTDLPTSIPAPVFGPPPASGKAIAELIHAGPGPAGLYAAAQKLREHAGELTATAGQLRGNATQIGQDWESPAGRAAAARITELGSWFDNHAGHATAAAAALEIQVDNYGRTRAAMPTPAQFDDLQRRLTAASVANAQPCSFGRYAPVITQLQTDLAKLNGQAISRYAGYSAGAANSSLPEPPPHPHSGIQAASYGTGGAPQAPPPPDPPHGKDPRYWLDLDKLIHVPDGQLAPHGYMQVGPGLFYPAPDPSPGFGTPPPPPPAKHPLDIADIVTKAPGQLGPAGTQQLIPGYFAPDPNAFYQPSPPWSPKEPIDVRDIIQVPKGTLAPWGYVEYLPGWFVPGPQLTNTPMSRCNED
jgi:PPE family protein/PE family protein